MERGQPHTTLTPNSIPPAIETPAAKLAFMALAVADGLTVDELQSRTNETKLALHGVLGALERKGLVERVDGTYFVVS